MAPSNRSEFEAYVRYRLAIVNKQSADVRAKKAHDEVEHPVRVLTKAEAELRDARHDLEALCK